MNICMLFSVFMASGTILWADIVQRNTHIKHGSLTQDAMYLDIAIVHGDGIFRDGKSQTSTTDLSGM